MLSALRRGHPGDAMLMDGGMRDAGRHVRPVVRPVKSAALPAVEVGLGVGGGGARTRAGVEACAGLWTKAGLDLVCG